MLFVYIGGSLLMYSNCGTPDISRVQCKPVIDMIFGYALFSFIMPYGAYISLKFAARMLTSLGKWINHGSK